MKPVANYCSERSNTFPSVGSHFCFPCTELRHADEPAVAAGSFLSHTETVSAPQLSNLTKFHISLRRLLLLFLSDQLMHSFILFPKLLRGISGYLTTEGANLRSLPELLGLLFGAAQAAHGRIRFQNQLTSAVK